MGGVKVSLVTNNPATSTVRGLTVSTYCFGGKWGDYRGITLSSKRKYSSYFGMLTLPVYLWLSILWNPGSVLRNYVLF